MSAQAPEDFDGMTVSERLFALGMLEEYIQASRQKDIPKIRELLKLVHVEDGAIENAIKNLDRYERL